MLVPGLKKILIFKILKVILAKQSLIRIKQPKNTAFYITIRCYLRSYDGIFGPFDGTGKKERLDCYSERLKNLKFMNFFILINKWKQNKNTSQQLPGQPIWKQVRS